MTLIYPFKMPLEENVSRKNIFWSNLIGKIRERKKNFPHCPFELPTNHLHQSSPDGPDRLCWLAGNSNGRCGKYFFSFLAFACKSLPKHIFSRDKFFKRHFQLIFNSVVYTPSRPYCYISIIEQLNNLVQSMVYGCHRNIRQKIITQTFLVGLLNQHMFNLFIT